MSRAAYDKARRPEYAERRRELRKGWKAKEAARAKAERMDPLRWNRNVLRHLRHRAKKQGISCTVTVEDIVLPEVCPVLGIPLVLAPGNALKRPDAPSVDRIKNHLGYVPGNVAVISLRANFLKKDATVAEVRALLAYMEGAE
jgi:hypothetical protein